MQTVEIIAHPLLELAYLVSQGTELLEKLGWDAGPDLVVVASYSWRPCARVELAQLEFTDAQGTAGW
jgi:hypothetical protein